MVLQDEMARLRAGIAHWLDQPRRPTPIPVVNTPAQDTLLQWLVLTARHTALLEDQEKSEAREYKRLYDPQNANRVEVQKQLTAKTLIMQKNLRIMKLKNTLEDVFLTDDFRQECSLFDLNGGGQALDFKRNSLRKLWDYCKVVRVIMQEMTIWLEPVLVLVNRTEQGKA